MPKLSCGHNHTEAEILKAAASIRGKRQTPHPGPGRNRLPDRCPCGEMTAKRAKARGHKC
jgi:hypothetical protein